MNLKLVREIKTPTITLGHLEAGKMVLMTCEDPVRDHKIPGVTAIPYGRYKVIINFSNRFKKHLPLLLDVPGFSGVRIHSGNGPEDTEGCILVGTTRTKAGVANSRYAMSLLMTLLEKTIEQGENIYIEVA